MSLPKTPSHLMDTLGYDQRQARGGKLDCGEVLDCPHRDAVREKYPGVFLCTQRLHAVASSQRCAEKQIYFFIDEAFTNIVSNDKPVDVEILTVCVLTVD